MGEREGGSVDLKKGLHVPFSMALTGIVLLVGAGGWVASQELNIRQHTASIAELKKDKKALEERLRSLELQVGRLRPWGELSTGNVFSVPSPDEE